MFRFESFRKTMLLSILGLSFLALTMGCQGKPQAKNQAEATKPSGTAEFVNTGGSTGGATGVATAGTNAAAQPSVGQVISPSGPLQIEKHESQ